MYEFGPPQLKRDTEPAESPMEGHQDVLGLGELNIWKNIRFVQPRGLRAVSTNTASLKLQLALRRAVPWQTLILLKMALEKYAPKNLDFVLL